jgi:hypothetical protein
MLLCDVTTEQHVQMESKSRKLALQRQIDAQWDQIEQQKMEEYDNRVKAKLQKEMIKKEANSKLI